MPLLHWQLIVANGKEIPEGVRKQDLDQVRFLRPAYLLLLLRTDALCSVSHPQCVVLLRYTRAYRRNWARAHA